ncbi:hypothetical protein [Methylobacterium haplocladii]|uniref:Uncharacterized protein n=1 Tax=Methylobacterium haplocladii TaxID=1176176 RepID=A0A512IPB6_9HYPH|nr:hypothetical protein [Methylobacterium haplocladii]GEO99478.1 hypothetical protein MHA02_18660 [Methylobacterium haplocladii]GJD83307.1 hypothetical protein HPGCJGGD_1173 [Methylobacterium haplocladii]GLS60389.1 hypothetical protein GCM10007887_30680 [Methylobacterium haplocladii]
MTGRSALILITVLAASGAFAEEAVPAVAPKPPERLQGFLSHGDSGDVLEDFFGSRVERAAPEETGGSRKYDPAIRWDDRPVRR